MPPGTPPQPVAEEETDSEDDAAQLLLEYAEQAKDQCIFVDWSVTFAHSGNVKLVVFGKAEF